MTKGTLNIYIAMVFAWTTPVFSQQRFDSADAAAQAAHHPDKDSATPYANRPWVEFVAGQMLLLFGSSPGEARAGVGTH